jgi:ketosteroid isomerase-like protein
MNRLLATLAILFFASSAATSEIIDDQEHEVAEIERAFAKTMADRDFGAFASFIDEEAIFVSGPDQILRGREQVTTAWRALFEGETAPFAWEPDEVLVLQSGRLALSSGPVIAPDGSITGRFNSTWRKNDNGEWKIVFDKGQPACRGN